MFLTLNSCFQFLAAMPKIRDSRFALIVFLGRQNECREKYSLHCDRSHWCCIKFRDTDLEKSINIDIMNTANDDQYLTNMRVFS